MVAYSWKSSVSDDWADAAAWTPTGGPPTSSSAVAISTATANYTVSVDFADSAASLTFSSATATLDIFGPSGSLNIAGALNQSAGTLNIGAAASQSGTLKVDGGAKLSGGALNINEGGLLSLTGTLSETAGDLNLNAGGAISGGVIDATGGAVNFNGGALNGVTFDGPLNLTASGASVHLVGGAKVVGSSGSGAGTINVTAKNAILYFDNTQTVSDETINVGASSGGAAVALNHIFSMNNASETLTLASTTTIDFTGYGSLTSGNFGGDGIVNQGLIEQTAGFSAGIGGSSFTNAGTINASDAGASFGINSNSFTNSGKIDISNGDQLVISSFNSVDLSATSAISVGAGSSLVIEIFNTSASWSSLGSITLASGSALDLRGAFTLANIGKIVNNGGSIDITGTLNNTGKTLDGSGGLGPVILDGGTVMGGIVKPTGVHFAGNVGTFISVGTLDDVTFDGPLNLTGQNENVELTGGSTIVGSSGTGPGVVNLTGAFSQLQFVGTETVANLTVNVGGLSSTQSPDVSLQDTGGTGQTLTLASSATIDFTGNGGLSVGANPSDSVVNKGLIEQTAAGNVNVNGELFTNSGAINASAVGGTLSIGATTFVNSGTIKISNGDQVTLGSSSNPLSSTTLSASSTITVGAGSSLTLGASNNPPGSPNSQGTWSNLGSITLASGSTLDLAGAFTLANLGKIVNNGGTIAVTGTLDDAGKTLDASAGLGPLTLEGGTVNGGIVKASGLSFEPDFLTGASTLNDVTFDGPLNLTGQNEYIELTGGSAVVGSSGSGPGLANVTGANAQLEFAGSQTVSNLTVNLGSYSNFADVSNGANNGGAEQTLTLAASTTIDFVGGGQLNAGNFPGDSIINQGLIDQTGALGGAQIFGNAFTNAGTLDAAGVGNNFQIGASTFSNTGTIEVSNQDFFNVSPQTNFTNFTSGTLTGGVYDITGGQFLINSGSAVTTLAADVSLSGDGSSFGTGNGPNFTSLDSSLTTIASTGALSLLDDRSWTTSGSAITDKGVITLGGGAITATATDASLTIAAGGKLVGYGDVAANSFTNSGTIEASGGPLQLNSAVAGTGTLQIDAGAELIANDAIASAQTVSFEGTDGALELLSPDNFDASIKGFAAGDTLLTSVSFDSFVENSAGTSGTLTLTSGSTTDHITFVGHYSSSLVTHSTRGGLTTIGYA